MKSDLAFHLFDFFGEVFSLVASGIANVLNTNASTTQVGSIASYEVPTAEGDH